MLTQDVKNGEVTMQIFRVEESSRYKGPVVGSLAFMKYGKKSSVAEA